MGNLRKPPKQAIDYAANHGVRLGGVDPSLALESLSTSHLPASWTDLVLDLDILALNAKHSDCIQSLFPAGQGRLYQNLLWVNSARKDRLNRFYIAPLFFTDHVSMLGVEIAP